SCTTIDASFLHTLSSAPKPPLFPSTTLFRSQVNITSPGSASGFHAHRLVIEKDGDIVRVHVGISHTDSGQHTAPVRIRAKHGARSKSTRLNSSHVSISYAVFCLKKKIINRIL